MAIKYLELLAPAKNLFAGIAAINAGADAVYIGASKFGARVSAGNTIEDIGELVRYAHQFRVKVYVTINTILYDDELDQAKELIRNLYESGVDGIIIQDMGILEMDLPPIPLIASTQMDNYSLEKIKFLEDIGFKRVILARELSLSQIKEIRANTRLELESFVHGALCVSFSGRCYMSQAMSKRSANRGECIQACRLPYSLIDGDGKVIAKDRHLLCLKDFNLSNDLEELVNAGVTSFKIEGRLKDEDYVTNVVYHYRQKLDEIIDSNPDLRKSSDGDVYSELDTDPEKTFNRSYTKYFFGRRERNILAVSPKSIGKKVGTVKSVSKDHFVIGSDVEVNNGDGLCFVDRNGEMRGSNVNVAEGKNIFMEDMKGLFVGAEVYRNFDIKFNKDLITNSPKRLVDVSISFKETKNGFSLVIEDEEGNKGICEAEEEKDIADNSEMAEKRTKEQLSKLGGTIFRAQDVVIKWKKSYFLPVSKINEMRRSAVDDLIKKREDNYKKEEFEIKNSKKPFFKKVLSYESNVSNKLAEKFYSSHGVEKIEPAFELSETKGRKVMTTKHCLRHYFGCCLKDNGGVKLKGPLYLLNDKGQRFRLEFDCSSCQMEIYEDYK